MTLWQELVEQTPGDRNTHRVLGVVYFNASRYEEAIEQFHLGLDNEDMEAATRIMPPGKAIIYLLVRAYDHAGRHEESRALVKKITRA